MVLAHRSSPLTACGFNTGSTHFTQIFKNRPWAHDNDFRLFWLDNIQSFAVTWLGIS